MKRFWVSILSRAWADGEAFIEAETEEQAQEIMKERFDKGQIAFNFNSLDDDSSPDFSVVEI